MASLVLELQAECLSDVPVTRLLTKAKVIAAKLGLTDTVAWIDSELDGYGNSAGLPDYRSVPGELVYFNPLYQSYMAILIPQREIAEIFTKHPVPIPISTIEEMKGNKNLYFGLTPALMEVVNGLLQGPPLEVRYHTSGAQFVRILDAVRRRIVDWTLKLEQDGILGEGLTFNAEEKHRVDEAKQIYNVNIGGNYAGAIGPVSDSGTVNATQIIQGVDVAALQALLLELRGDLSDAQFIGRDDIEQSLAKLDEEAESGEPRKNAVLKCLNSVKGLLGKAASFAGKEAAMHAVDHFVDSLPL
jgi:hypothetical protein